MSEHTRHGSGPSVLESPPGVDLSLPRVSAVGRALPTHYADQETLITAFRAAWAGAHFNLQRLEELHRAVQVRGRFLALPIAEYSTLTTFATRNEMWRRCAIDLGEKAVRDGLKRAGLSPTDVDHLFCVTTTGIATPSIDAYLVNRLGLRKDVRRTPIFGLGCAGGAAGLTRAADWLRAYPEGVAVLLSVELCSLTLQRDDLSIPNIIASGLFGDGAAAVVLTGGSRNDAGPQVAASGCSFYPDTERVMGWDVVDSGLKIILSSSVPDVVREYIGGDVDRFLAAQGLSRKDVHHWLAHTGGPKVLKAFEDALALPSTALERSWKSLADTGNLSSASVLFVLGELLDSGEARPGDVGLIAAMGPAFASELVLLRW